ncbi:CHASE domain-containing protein [Ramlibacter sp.]|uniref:CHASE domain-containing protein n=1 Tax=Ramlibacter sp. TaxID=1917967 RepID=UPI002CC14E37|nr:CHASE domain-containing protein [Ramlibacter sp.]HWI81969.1 CHASE domain-containing protein [Ramlibacter sp.]
MRALPVPEHSDPDRPHPVRRDWTGSHLWPVAVLALALAATLAATLGVNRLLQARHAGAVAAAVEDETAQVEGRLGTYLALLRATRAFVTAEGAALSRESFRAFVTGIEVARHYPGIQGIGYSPRVDPQGVGAFEEAARRGGAAGFHLFPPGPREPMFSILYLEPLDERNRAALGFDMFSEPVRAQAMAAARDQGAAAMTSRVILKQEIDEHKAAGFLLYVPYYGAGPEPRTVAERRQRLVAFLYAPFRAPDFFGSAPRRGAALASLQRVYAAPAPQRELLLYEAPGARPDTSRLLRTLAVPGQTWTLEFAAQRLPRGERIQVLATAASGLVISLLLFFFVRSLRRARAATEQQARAERGQRELAESLLASERAARQSAEEQHALMGRQVQFGEMLVGIVSHDLRNPLNVIMLNAEVLRRHSLPGPLARSVERIQEGCRMSLALIRDLLDFTQARLGSGIPVTRVAADVTAIVERAVDQLRTMHPDRTLLLHTSGSGEGEWDADRLTQVVVNLVTNALVYGRPDMPVTVAVSGTAQRVAITVHNDGEPIPPELQSAIFEPLRQGGGRQGANARNIGLGLYIVRQVVQAHGGAVGVVSSADGGTTFRMELPRSDAARRAADGA